MPQTVADLMNHDVLTVLPTTPLSQAIQILVDRQISGFRI